MPRWIACVIFALSLTQATTAAEPRFDDAGLAKIPQRMQELIKSGRLAGAVTLIASQDAVLHHEAVGKSSITTGQTMRKDSLFRIASMTKTVTAAALMMLVEEGRLSVDDPVAKYIPSFQNQKFADGRPARPVTIKEVLTHTAGLAQPPKDPEAKSLAEMVDSIARQPLAFEAGSKWQYSSGLTVAGRLIEVVSGQSYSDFLQARIFTPLGMKDTTFVLNREQLPRLAETVKPGAQSGTIEAVEIPDPTVDRVPNPSGGLYSTALDMAKFYQAILTDSGNHSGKPRLLRGSTIQQMLAIQSGDVVTGFTPGNGWGLGWCVVKEPQGVTRLMSPGTYGHGGAWGTQAWVDPARGLIFLLMLQRSGFGNSDGSEVRDAFNELAVKAHRGVDGDDARFAKIGAYDSAIELRHGAARAILCPQAGGRVLQFSNGNRNALWLDEREAEWKPGNPGPSSAGRFDFGPELTTASHPVLWSGEWTGEIVRSAGSVSARLTSQQDAASGVQLQREFTLSYHGDAARLICRQTIMNISAEPRAYCHWGRSFSPGGGICLIPLKGQSRFPSKYAMYEDSAIINVRNQDERIRERDGFLEILAPPRKPKLGFDSEAGWLGYLMPGDSLFVKRFAVEPDRVYNEAAALKLSVWYPEGPRIELEPIGPQERLQPGSVASFTEDWWLLPYPFPKTGEQIDLKQLKTTVEEKTVAGK